MEPATLMKPAKVITKANALIEASYSLTLNEQRIILACAAHLDSRKPVPKDNLFVVKADDLTEMFDLDPNSVYRCMEEAANRLYERDIKRIEGRVRTRMRWVHMAQYCKGEGKIKLGFSPEVVPYLTLLHRRFTSYRLAEIRELKSAVSVRIFEMLMQYQHTGVFSITIEDLRERLQLGDKYPRFANLRQRILDPVAKEVTAKTMLDVSWHPIKEGRTVKRIEFRFEEKAQMSLL